MCGAFTAPPAKHLSSETTREIATLLYIILSKPPTTMNQLIFGEFSFFYKILVVNIFKILVVAAASYFGSVSPPRVFSPLIFGSARSDSRFNVVLYNTILLAIRHKEKAKWWIPRLVFPIQETTIRKVLISPLVAVT